MLRKLKKKAAAAATRTTSAIASTKAGKKILSVSESAYAMTGAGKRYRARKASRLRAAEDAFLVDLMEAEFEASLLASVRAAFVTAKASHTDAALRSGLEEDPFPSWVGTQVGEGEYEVGVAAADEDGEFASDLAALLGSSFSVTTDPDELHRTRVFVLVYSDHTVDEGVARLVTDAASRFNRGETVIIPVVHPACSDYVLDAIPTKLAYSLSNTTFFNFQMDLDPMTEVFDDLVSTISNFLHPDAPSWWLTGVWRVELVVTGENGSPFHEVKELLIYLEQIDETHIRGLSVDGVAYTGILDGNNLLLSGAFTGKWEQFSEGWAEDSFAFVSDAHFVIRNQGHALEGVYTDYSPRAGLRHGSARASRGSGGITGFYKLELSSDSSNPSENDEAIPLAIFHTGATRLELAFPGTFGLVLDGIFENDQFTVASELGPQKSITFVGYLKRRDPDRLQFKRHHLKGVYYAIEHGLNRFGARKFKAKYLTESKVGLIQSPPLLDSPTGDASSSNSNSNSNSNSSDLQQSSDNGGVDDSDGLSAADAEAAAAVAESELHTRLLAKHMASDLAGVLAKAPRRLTPFHPDEFVPLGEGDFAAVIAASPGIHESGMVDAFRDALEGEELGRISTDFARDAATARSVVLLLSTETARDKALIEFVCEIAKTDIPIFNIGVDGWWDIFGGGNSSWDPIECARFKAALARLNMTDVQTLDPLSPSFHALVANIRKLVSPRVHHLTGAWMLRPSFLSSVDTSSDSPESSSSSSSSPSPSPSSSATGTGTATGTATTTATPTSTADEATPTPVGVKEKKSSRLSLDFNLDFSLTSPGSSSSSLPSSSGDKEDLTYFLYVLHEPSATSVTAVDLRGHRWTGTVDGGEVALFADGMEIRMRLSSCGTIMKGTMRASSHSAVSGKANWTHTASSSVSRKERLQGSAQWIRNRLVKMKAFEYVGTLEADGLSGLFFENPESDLGAQTMAMVERAKAVHADWLNLPKKSDGTEVSMAIKGSIIRPCFFGIFQRGGRRIVVRRDGGFFQGTIRDGVAKFVIPSGGQKGEFKTVIGRVVALEGRGIFLRGYSFLSSRLSFKIAYRAKKHLSEIAVPVSLGGVCPDDTATSVVTAYWRSLFAGDYGGFVSLWVDGYEDVLSPEGFVDLVEASKSTKPPLGNFEEVKYAGSMRVENDTIEAWRYEYEVVFSIRGRTKWCFFFDEAMQLVRALDKEDMAARSRTFLHDCMISYRSTDAGFIDLVQSYLEDNGISTWRDRRMESGANWSAEITRAVRTSGCVISCLSAPYLKSSLCTKEARLALEVGQTIIPLVLPNKTDLVPDPYTLEGPPITLANALSGVTMIDLRGVHEGSQTLACKDDLRAMYTAELSALVRQIRHCRSNGIAWDLSGRWRLDLQIVSEDSENMSPTLHVSQSANALTGRATLFGGLIKMVMDESSSFCLGSRVHFTLLCDDHQWQITSRCMLAVDGESMRGLWWSPSGNRGRIVGTRVTS